LNVNNDSTSNLKIDIHQKSIDILKKIESFNLELNNITDEMQKLSIDTSIVQKVAKGLDKVMFH